jgi:hypothetical protein
MLGPEEEDLEDRLAEERLAQLAADSNYSHLVFVEDKGTPQETQPIDDALYDAMDAEALKALSEIPPTPDERPLYSSRISVAPAVTDTLAAPGELSDEERQRADEERAVQHYTTLGIINTDAAYALKVQNAPPGLPADLPEVDNSEQPDVVAIALEKGYGDKVYGGKS